MKKVLVVDDELSIRTLLTYQLTKAGYEVVEVDNGRDALALGKSSDLDFIVLDIMLPQLDGIEVCKQLRQAGVETPILLLTAKDEELDKIIGLELGADDYMTKPFSPRELMARIKAILRRTAKILSNQVQEKVICLQDVVLYEEQHEVRQAGELLTLTPKEFELLHYLMKGPNRTFSREQLLDAVWGFAFTGETRMVDVHIGKLREKLADDSKSPRYIVTVRGFGYKFLGEQP